MFKTLDDLKSDKKDKNEEEKKNVDWYSGGNSSGMAVSSGDEVEKIVNKAKENTSSGEGLGDREIQLKISLYENGFLIDDGELRPYEGDKNKLFIKELSDGYVPTELQSKYKGKKVDVSLEDKRKDTYVPPPPPAYLAYSGAGASMGGADGVGLEVNKETGMPVVNEDEDTTSLQIRFHNGERQIVPFNLTHTVADIHTYLMQAAPVDGSYQLVTGFPPKPIDNPDQTIEEAGLKSAAITQKII
ncbi:unnamed protein product [Moneuplotes crassus]|uniref:Uncharacterized protein n=1 Tax=Euplotes crassus TaxID=5936 RepID=A0AAD1XW19_EUPCR|nr:unnamed protein product [Moneuplotes crassus]